MAMTEYDYDIEDERGVYPLIRSMDKSLRGLSNDFYEFRRETNYRLTTLEKTTASLTEDVLNLKTQTAIINRDITDLKSDVKELRGDVSDIKGDIRELSAKFDSVQARFNWGLVILGLIVALIQMLK